MTQPLIDIRPDHWVIASDILRRHVPDREVWAFGSRANWTAKEHSDLDLAILGDRPMPLELVGDLRDAFAECDLPFKVDVVDWASTSESFKEIIRKSAVVVQRRTRESRQGIPNGWELHHLEYCMAAIIDYRGKTPQKTSFGIPLITAKVVKDGRIETPDEFIAVEDYELWMRRGIPQAGDVVITTEAPLGEVAQLGPERVALAQRLIALRGKSGVLDNVFLKFLMQSGNVQEQLRARASGTTVLGIKQSELRKVLLTLPPIDEQRAIAHILGMLDDKIELNRRMNETLEAMAKALFKSWFEDFDPVRARAEGRDPGLPKHIADLFPNSFEDSELGEIPKGWMVRPLGDLLELAYGKALKEENRQPGTIPVYGSNGQVGWHNEALAPGPGIVVGRKGNPGIVTWAATEFFCIDTTFYVVPKESCRGLYFLYYSLLAQDLASLGADSAVPGLSRNLAYMSKQLVPHDATLDAFAAILQPLFKRKYRATEESRTLAALRDTLLPKLISGELRVGDAERFVGRHV